MNGQQNIKKCIPMVWFVLKVQKAAGRYGLSQYIYRFADRASQYIYLSN